MMKKTLYVHIGTTKTGTTAIQGFCVDNKEVLNRKGYVYPLFPYHYQDVTDRRNAHFLIAEDCKDNNGVFREGMDKILELFQTYPNVILSDEGIWSAGYDRRMGMFKALKKESKEHGFQVKIIVYLRRQDTYLISGWNQMVKSGIGDSVDTAWADYIDDRERISKMNYGTNLSKMAKVWGKKKILVRRFEPKHFVGGSIYADFLQTIGLELTDEYTIAEAMRNMRLSGNTHEIKRILNGMPDMDVSDNSFFRRALLSYADVSGKIYPNEMFSEAEAKAFMKKYEEENRQVSEDFFDGEPLFELDWKDVPKWEKDNPYMMDDVIRFVGACCMQLRAENAQLRQEVQELRKKVSNPIRTIGQKVVGKVIRKERTQIE